MLFGWLSCPQGIQKVPRLDPEGSTTEFPIMTHQVKRIAIIGAGSGGLAALKIFIHDIPKRDGERWEIDLFERRSNLGGIWSSQKSLTHHSSRLTNLFPILYPGCGTMILLDIHISPKHRCTHNSRRTPLLRQVTINLLIFQYYSRGAYHSARFISDIPWLPIPTLYLTFPILRPHTGLPPRLRHPFQPTPLHPSQPLAGVGLLGWELLKWILGSHDINRRATGGGYFLQQVFVA